MWRCGLRGPRSVVAEASQRSTIDLFRHAVEVDEETEEDFVGCRAVLVNAAEIAQDGDARYVLAVKCKDACGLLAESRCAFWRRNVLVYVLVLLIVRGCDLGQETGDHFDNVCNWHCTDFVLLSYLLLASQRMP